MELAFITLPCFFFTIAIVTARAVITALVFPYSKTAPLLCGYEDDWRFLIANVMPASSIGVFQANTEQVCAESRSARDRRRFGSRSSISSLEEVIGADLEGDGSSADVLDVLDGGSHVAGIPPHNRAGQLDRPRTTSWQAIAARVRHAFFCRRTAIYVAVVLMIVAAYYLLCDYNHTEQAHIASDNGHLADFPHLMPDLTDEYYDQTKELAPDEWIQQNSFLDSSLLPAQRLQHIQATRPKAALVALVRNSELGDMLHTVAQVEARFNSRGLHRYDWVFFSDGDFSENFQAAVTNSTSSHCFFERVPKEHWSVPSWIDRARFDIAREPLEDNGFDKAWLEDYHHMCRWNSGLFALEERLQDYNWFWRVEPGAKYTCGIQYDVFRFMQENKMTYGFNMAILDDAQSFSSLWEKTQAFRNIHKKLVHKEADMAWALHRSKDPDSLIRATTMIQDTPLAGDHGRYDHCHFYSNFEVGSLDFFRGRAHQAYFHHLDKSGGFYYERFCHPLVHTLSISMFLPKRQVWYFRDIGYPDGLCEDCPMHPEALPVDPESDPKKIRMAELEAGLKESQQTLKIHQLNFEKERKAPSLQSGCTIGGLDRDNSRLVPYQAMQKRPNETCIRMWLKGEWLLKKKVRVRQGENTIAGSGHGGYLFHNKESDWFDTGSFAKEEDPQGKRPDWGPRVDNGNAPTVCTAFSVIILSLMATLHFFQ